MKRTFLSALALILSVIMMCSCGVDASNDGNADKPSLTDDENVDIPAVDPLENLTEEERIHIEMLNRSLVSVGNTERINRAIEKARNGEEVTLAYLGGSITQGAGADPEATQCYAYVSAQIFAEKFASDKEKVNYINAGIAGTPSLLGITRCNQDVISKNPDVVFIEFAVNDGTDSTNKEIYESLVRKLLNSETSPAVILIFTVLENGYSAQDNMQAIGAHYDLGMISVGNAIMPEVEAGRMTFVGDYATDPAHPTNYGHALIAEFIGYYLDAAAKTDTAKYTIPSELHYKAGYENLMNITDGSEFITDAGDFKYGSLNCFTYTGGWKRSASEENNPMVIEMNCSRLIIAFKQERSTKCGSIDIFVDGEKVKTIEGYSESAWGNIVTEIVYTSSESAAHAIEIKMAEGHEGKTFTLLGIGYVE